MTCHSRYLMRILWILAGASFLRVVGGLVVVGLLPVQKAPSALCFLRVLGFAWFSLHNFDKYPIVFRNDSQVTLAQAGMYFGPGNIEEYVKFVAAEFSPYIEEDSGNVALPEFIQYDSSTDNCIFLMKSLSTYRVDPEFTRSAASFENVAMARMHLAYKENYIAKIEIYYPPGFLELIFGNLLNSENTRSWICGLLRGTCSPYVDKEQQGNCENRLAALPTTQGDSKDIDGNSQGCRDLHAVLASINPQNHCPHISLSPLADPSGQIKCQDSSRMNIRPSDLFSEADFAAFDEFAIANGFDPQVGHNYGA